MSGKQRLGEFCPSRKQAGSELDAAINDPRWGAHVVCWGRAVCRPEAPYSRRTAHVNQKNVRRHLYYSVRVGEGRWGWHSPRCLRRPKRIRGLERHYVLLTPDAQQTIRLLTDGLARADASDANAVIYAGQGDARRNQALHVHTATVVDVEVVCIR